jgi:hypothetical protein
MATKQSITPKNRSKSAAVPLDFSIPTLGLDLAKEGIAWFNSLSERERAAALKAANKSVPAEAWAHYKRSRGPTPVCDMMELNLARMEKVAEKLDIPLWMLLIPGLDKHPDLLEVGALKPLEAIVENYLQSSPKRRQAALLAAQIGALQVQS